MDQQGYQIENVWQEKNEALQEEIVTFWLEQKALPEREQAAQRVNQVVYVVRDSEGRIVGLNTAYPQLNQRLGNYFFYIRGFVSPVHRRNKILERLTKDTYDFFNQRFQEGKNPRIIGLFAVVESKALQQHVSEAIREGFVYIGQDKQGNHLRVAYFDGASIQPGGGLTPPESGAVN